MKQNPSPSEFPEATARYEAWLAQHVSLIGADLRLKHARMQESPSSFLRATFYRWAELWPTTCPELASGPTVLAVGDLHVQNFGTWRDIEGRLIWGVNDFDEACQLPYTNDLVRLATSVLLAAADNGLSSDGEDGVRAILDGYREGLDAGGGPFVLAEGHRALRKMAVYRLKDPEKFWEKLESSPGVRGYLPPGVAELLARALPDRNLPSRMVHRIAGLGSLGRQRFVVIAHWRGARVAREAKALAPPVWKWAQAGGGRGKVSYREALTRAVRCPDPHVRVRGRWLLRRLAPDSSRIELGELPKERDEIRLLHAMGWETANVHLGCRDARAVGADVRRRGWNWLYEAARHMAGAVTRDWRSWNAWHDR